MRYQDRLVRRLDRRLDDSHDGFCGQARRENRIRIRSTRYRPRSDVLVLPASSDWTFSSDGTFHGTLAKKVDFQSPSLTIVYDRLLEFNQLLIPLSLPSSRRSTLRPKRPFQPASPSRTKSPQTVHPSRPLSSKDSSGTVVPRRKNSISSIRALCPWREIRAIRKRVLMLSRRREQLNLRRRYREIRVRSQRCILGGLGSRSFR